MVDRVLIVVHLPQTVDKVAGLLNDVARRWPEVKVDMKVPESWTIDIPADGATFTFMPDTDLAAAVERTVGTLSQTQLGKRTKLATRTLRELMDPNSTRRFRRDTVGKLDAP